MPEELRLEAIRFPRHHLLLTREFGDRLRHRRDLRLAGRIVHRAHQLVELRIGCLQLGHHLLVPLHHVAHPRLGWCGCLRCRQDGRAEKRRGNENMPGHKASVHQTPETPEAPLCFLCGTR